MPSRKRTKGRARKASKAISREARVTAKATAVVGAGAGMAPMTRIISWIGNCRHGLLESLPPLLANVVYNILDGFLHNVGCISTLNAVRKMYPFAFEDEVNLNVVKKSLIAMGTGDLQDNEYSTEASVVARKFMRAVLLLDAYHPSLSFEQTFFKLMVVERSSTWLRYSDASTGCQRSLLRFFHERSPCGCLEERYIVAKQLSYTGICHHCGVRKERSNLLVCQGCKKFQFCSYECHQAEWPCHKTICKMIHGMAQKMK